MTTPIRWAMIDSVADKELLPQLTEFGKWLVNILETEGAKKGAHYTFDREPQVVLHVKPGCHDDVDQAYKSILYEYARVLLVIHILPGRNSPEYEWMKTLADRYGLIRQGVLVENAVSHFANLDRNMIVENILKWISRRLHEIVSCNGVHSPFTLLVGEGSSVQTTNLSMDGVELAVQKVLRERVPVNEKVSISSVRVEGFPSVMNRYQLATVFADFIIKSVEMIEDYAIIEFATKFQAAQAAIMYNGHNVDSKHQLSVVPIHPEVLRHI
uniref:RRM domain-containing protein n=1 Tax=Ascaris lumbricoides TaxID=6252 RepID=A0A9J2Q1X8_ASCLU